MATNGARQLCERPAAAADMTMLGFMRSLAEYVIGMLAVLVHDDRDLEVTLVRSVDTACRSDRDTAWTPREPRCSMAAAGDRDASGRVAGGPEEEWCACHRPRSVDEEWCACHRPRCTDKCPRHRSVEHHRHCNTADPGRLVEMYCDQLSDILNGIYAVVDSRVSWPHRQDDHVQLQRGGRCCCRPPGGGCLNTQNTVKITGTIENPDKSSYGPLQCYKCQDYGHTQRYCHHLKSSNVARRISQASVPRIAPVQLNVSTAPKIIRPTSGGADSINPF